jgi:hypothetical protein
VVAHIVDAIANGFKHETMLKKSNSLEDEKTKLAVRIKEIEEKRQECDVMRYLWKTIWG